MAKAWFLKTRLLILRNRKVPPQLPDKNLEVAEWKEVTGSGYTNKITAKASDSSNVATTKETAKASPSENNKSPKSPETNPARSVPSPRIRNPTPPKPPLAPTTSLSPSPRKTTPPENNSSSKPATPPKHYYCHYARRIA